MITIKTQHTMKQKDILIVLTPTMILRYILLDGTRNLFYNGKRSYVHLLLHLQNKVSINTTKIDRNISSGFYINFTILDRS
jgi:hypothetical protein